MKDIETFILEQEYDNHFLIEESFFEWVIKLGKKFWEWLTKKDFTGDDVDWSVGKSKKIRWVETSSDKILKITKNKGLRDNFTKTCDIIDEHGKKIILYQAFNSSKTPIIMMLLTDDKEIIHKALRRSERNYKENKNKIDNAEKASMILSIEIAKNNKDDDDDIFEDYVIKEIDDSLLKKYNFIFLNQRSLNKWFYNTLAKTYKLDSKFAVIEGDGDDANWSEVSNEIQSQEDDNKKDANDDTKKDTNDTEKDTNDDTQKDTDDTDKNKTNTFDIKDLTFTYSVDEDEIKNAIDKKLDNDYKYILINDIKDNDSSPKTKDIEKIILSDDFKKTIRDLLNVKDETEIFVCFKISTDVDHKPYIKSFDNMSTASWDSEYGDINFETTDKKNGLFIMNLSESLNESLDIDNIFWMLDTWFSNNEQERSTFMSIIDNCLIKKTYNKNDLAKLCDTINFEIRPFVNFMCKDAVIEKGQREDPNIDYYYELKKIIDALISNKSTANRYVRGS